MPEQSLAAVGIPNVPNQITVHFLDSGVGVPEDRQDCVEKECCHCGSYAQAKEGDHERQQCQARNGLHDTCRPQGNLSQFGRASDGDS